MDWIANLLAKNPVVQTRIKQAISSASVAVGAWVLSHMLDWVEAHLTFVSHENAIALAGTVATFVAGLVLIGGNIAYSWFVDPNNVHAKVVVAAATGSAEAANDPAKLSAAKEAIKAGTPEALNDLVAKLSAGKV